ncbi:MAG: TM2 domain-containing protein [Mogibacterium sp.]|nr:TM2 domain-containing protein [Mogibacterium sp.]
MREFTNNCQREGLALPDSFAAWHIALSKLTTQPVVDALNHIFNKNQERVRKMQEEGMPDRGPAFAPEAAAHITLEQLRQSLRMTGDLDFSTNTYYNAQEDRQRAEYEAFEAQRRAEEERRRAEEARRAQQGGAYRQDAYTSTKDWLATLLLCVFTGVAGGHCFYTGKIGKGILYLFTGGLWGLGVLYDLIKLASGTYEDGQGRIVRNR